MKIRFVFCILPAFIEYKDSTKEVRNYAKGCFIRLEPIYRYDEGIHQHEFEHVRQWYRFGMIFFSPLYQKVRKFRLWAEAMAYLRQTKYPDRNGHYLTLEEAALKLTWARYRLNITKEEALEYLNKENG